MGPIKHFRQLEVWQEAHRLVLMVYQVTREYPSDERFGLISQMRRAAVSIAANIAEGFKRRGIQDKIRFYNTSEASPEELKYYFLLSKDLEYISSDSQTNHVPSRISRSPTQRPHHQDRTPQKTVSQTPYSLIPYHLLPFTENTQAEQCPQTRSSK
jgi:four helix bundle protein